MWSLIAIFFATSGISVITGSTSLITVPAMLQFGIDARIALATNMFALTFMSIGGSLPFLRGKDVDRKRLPALIILTVAGSLCGAFLLLVIPQRSVPLIVSTAMIAVASFSIVYRKSGAQKVVTQVSATSELVGYALTFLLGIYGGFFSGGYVTILTAAYVAVFRLSFVEAMATTKVVNVFSSGIATIVFMWHHLVDLRLGSVLAITMFVGASIGARLAIRLGEQWLRRIFLAAVWTLGLKMLFYDVLARSTGCSASEPSR
ncbi:MAG: sulfite exporter TauE/SafE family protein [Bryobacteraceae bacterium]